jgi:hypothetical protein
VLHSASQSTQSVGAALLALLPTACRGGQAGHPRPHPFALTVSPSPFRPHPFALTLSPSPLRPHSFAPTLAPPPLRLHPRPRALAPFSPSATDLALAPPADPPRHRHRVDGTLGTAACLAALPSFEADRTGQLAPVPHRSIGTGAAPGPPTTPTTSTGAAPAPIRDRPDAAAIPSEPLPSPLPPLPDGPDGRTARTRSIPQRAPPSRRPSPSPLTLGLVSTGSGSGRDLAVRRRASRRGGRRTA